jgi:hypothetical protein
MKRRNYPCGADISAGRRTVSGGRAIQAVHTPPADRLAQPVGGPACSPMRVKQRNSTPFASLLGAAGPMKIHREG